MSTVMRRLLAKWQSYRYRFVPWVAWNLRERTVRSVKNANQDKIIPDRLVMETYVKLFSALDGNLPNGEQRYGRKLQGPQTESRFRNGMGVRPNTRLETQDNGVSDRLSCHDDGAQGSHDKQISLARIFFGGTCESCCSWNRGSSWTCRNGGGRNDGGVCLRRHPQTITQKLLQYQYSTSCEKESLEDKNYGHFCGKSQPLIRNLMRNMTLTTSFGFENRTYGYHHCYGSSLHRPPVNHHHHHHHHHSSYCHQKHSCQRIQKFQKQKNISPWAQLPHQQSCSAHRGRSYENTSNQDKGDDLDPGATIMHQTLGYAVGRRPSQIEGGGIGVYVTKGVVPRGAVVAMYPGTIYYPAEPILFQSIANPFVFRCLDGIHIDGNDKRLSKMIYRSCAQRDRLGPYMFSDLSWLTSCPLNPLAVGQYVNNQHKGAPANVCYQEFDVPVDFPLNLRKYIPNTFYSTLPDIGNTGRNVRTVALVSLREIQCGEELLSSYFTLIY